MSKDDVMKKISNLESGGQDAWDKEDTREWEQVNKEAQALLQSLQPKGVGSIEDVDPTQLAAYLIDWLAEIAGQVKTRQLEDEFAAEIDSVKGQVRAVDLDDTDAARKQLIKIVGSKIKPLEQRVANASVSDKDGGRVEVR